MKTSFANRFARRRRPVVSCVLAALYAATALGADSPMGSVEFKAGTARIESELIADRTACDQLAGNRRDVCRERAGGKEWVARAELEAARIGTRQARDKLTAVKLDVAYDIERTMCNDKGSSEKIACAKQAQAARSQGEAALRVQSDRAGPGAAQAQREADYRLDALKCGELSVDGRAACLVAAKARAGKT